MSKDSESTTLWGTPLPSARPPTLAQELKSQKKNAAGAKSNEVKAPSGGARGRKSPPSNGSSKTKKKPAGRPAVTNTALKGAVKKGAARAVQRPRAPKTLAGFARQINASHKRCQARFRDSVEHARRAGELLELAQRELRVQKGHGHWGAWLTTNCPEISDRTAQQYMRVAKRIRELGDDSAAVAELSGKSLKTLDKIFGDDQSAEAKKARRDRKEAALAEATAAAAEGLGHGLYNVFYVDCPWRYEPWSRKTGMDRAADNHYPTMTIPALLEMGERVQPMIAAAAGGFFWATVPFLLEALRVMEAWGFAYKSHYIWRKPKPIHGHWNYNRHELLLIGTRGGFPAPAKGTQEESVIDAEVPGPQEHSRKPAVFREMIEGWYPNVAKFELFARQDKDPDVPIPEGWDVWGNEAPPAPGEAET